MRKIRNIPLLAAALVSGVVVSIGASKPANADVCAHLAGRIAEIAKKEQQALAMFSGEAGYISTEQLQVPSDQALRYRAIRADAELRTLRHERARYEREYNKKGCAAVQAMQDARTQRATQQAIDTTLGIVGFGVTSGLLGGPRRSSPYPSSPPSSPYSSRRRY